VTEVHCTYDPATRGGDAPDGRKVKSTIQWVSAQHAIQAEIRLYDRLFTAENPDEGEDVTQVINPNSLEIVTDCFLEPSLAEAQPGDKFQFERTGYFCVDLDSTPEKAVFNRTVTLKDSWAKIEKSGKV
jgi:glutaminyl-tRNA synthetase